jgi:CRP-like cAMP-binding protein
MSLYIQKGGVRLSIVNETGREAVVGVLGPGDFFGEGCLAGQPIRIGTASAITATTVLIIEKKEMIRVLHVEHGFSDRFIIYMLSRNIQIEESLVDQLFNSSEKRLARALLLLGNPRYSGGKRERQGVAEIQAALGREAPGVRSRLRRVPRAFERGSHRYDLEGSHSRRNLESVLPVPVKEQESRG